MQRTRFLEDVRALDDEGVAERLADLQGELIRLRFQLAIRQLENHRRIRDVRKQIAQIKTIQHERLLDIQQRPPARRAGRGAEQARAR